MTQHMENKVLFVEIKIGDGCDWLIKSYGSK